MDHQMRGLVPHTGFEPVISALRGRRPGPLDECGPAGAGGEPPRPVGMIPATPSPHQPSRSNCRYRRLASRKLRMASATCWKLVSPATNP